MAPVRIIPPRSQRSSRPPGLPDFKRPPIDEVVLSIQFGSLTNFRSGHVGVLWNEFRREYPKMTEQMPLMPAFETFGAPPQTPFSGIQIESFLAPPMGRFWFEESNGYELLQIQQDRIIHNWRKRETEQRYPRYEAIRDRFRTEAQRFIKLVSDEMLGEVKPNQCEVTYINLIDLPDGMHPHQHVERITTLWSGTQSEKLPLEFENVSFQTRYILREDDQPSGRVYVMLAPVFHVQDHRPVIRLEITARAKPKGASIADAFLLLDVERKAVVETFAAVTTPDMHKIWERTDAP